MTSAVAGLGRIIQGPLRGWPAEDAVNRLLIQRGGPCADRATWLLSTYSDTVPTIVTAAASGWWLRRRGEGWAVAARPLTAITLETAVFMAAAAVVGRPRPDVRRLDRPAPTSSFPSGHTGASTALHWTLAERAGEGGSWGPGLRWLVPPLVGLSRLYRGMHHPSDVVVGAAVGAWAASAAGRALAAGSQRA